MQILDYFKSHRWIPLIGGGKQSLHLVGVDEVAEACYKAILDERIYGDYYLGDRRSISFREFYALLSELLGQRKIYVPLPVLPISFVLQFLGDFIPGNHISHENLLGLKQMVSFDKQKFRFYGGVRIRPARETLRRFFKEVDQEK